MLGTIINAGVLITLFAIAAPFIFVLLVIRITTGSRHDRRTNGHEKEEMEDISKGLRDLNRRIDNLETLNKHKKDKE